MRALDGVFGSGGKLKLVQIATDILSEHTVNGQKLDDLGNGQEMERLILQRKCNLEAFKLDQIGYIKGDRDDTTNK